MSDSDFQLLILFLILFMTASVFLIKYANQFVKTCSDLNEVISKKIPVFDKAYSEPGSLKFVIKMARFMGLLFFSFSGILLIIVFLYYLKLIHF
jgi:hypothetical protein